MPKKLQREYRGRKLTSEEITRDEDVRRMVEKEFPPAGSAASPIPHSLSDGLRRAIHGSDRTVDQIADQAGVSQIVVSRFLSGERDIRMITADKLADALGLKLTAGK